MTMSGVALLALYMVCDSFTSSWQGAVFARYQCGALHMLCAVNAFSCALTAAAHAHHAPPLSLLHVSTHTLLSICPLHKLCTLRIHRILLFHRTYWLDFTSLHTAKIKNNYVTFNSKRGLDLRFIIRRALQFAQNVQTAQNVNVQTAVPVLISTPLG